MLIKQRRIVNLLKLAFIEDGIRISFGININNITQKRLENLWLLGLDEWIAILPPIVGSISKYNAEGKEEKQKDLPMETHYSEIYWTRHQWIGRWRTEEITEIAYRPYKKYPVKYIDPPAIEIYTKDSRIYADITLILGKDNKLIKHTINLFLELFWECELLEENKVPLIKTSWLTRYNREFIKPWTKREDFKKQVDTIAKYKSENQKKIINYRLDVAEKLWLNPIGYGTYGFHGYIAFQNKDASYTIFENINYWNAIYITSMDRKKFSQKDKQTILSQWIQKDRIIHNKWRENQLKKYS